VRDVVCVGMQARYAGAKTATIWCPSMKIWLQQCGYGICKSFS